MAILTMENKEGNPIYHDFMGASCTESSPMFRPSDSSPSPSVSIGANSGGHGLVSTSSDLGSERHAGSNFESAQFLGSKSNFSGPEMSNSFSGRKRSNSDSAFMGSIRDRMLQMGSDSLDNSRMMKILRNEAGGERPRKVREDEPFFAMQPPRPTSTSLILQQQPPISSRPDLVPSKMERSLPANAGPMVHYPSRLGQFGMYMDKLPSNRYKDTSAGTSLISQPAADEGSRTGIKGSGIGDIINANSGGATERNSTGVLSGNRPKNASQNSEPESANPSRHSLTSSSRQMTIFYAGQAHVFDDVHPEKADLIMALAGTNGASWSTTYSSKANMGLPLSESHTPNGRKEMGIGSLALSQELNGMPSVLGNSSHRFCQTTTSVDPVNLQFGGHQGGTAGRVRDSRTILQLAEPDTKGKREVRQSQSTWGYGLGDLEWRKACSDTMINLGFQLNQLALSGGIL